MADKNKPIVNITPKASAKGLRDLVLTEARRRGLNPRHFVGDIYEYAVRNRRKFHGPLKQPRAEGGEHIGAVVSDKTASELSEWAVQRKTNRTAHCRYILEKALEDGLIAQAVGDSRE